MNEEKRNELVAEGKVRYIYRDDKTSWWIYAGSPPEANPSKITLFDSRVAGAARAIMVLKQSYGEGVVFLYGRGDCTRKVDEVIDV